MTSKVLFGLATYNYPPDYTQIQNDSATLNHRVDVVHNFQDWGFDSPGDWGTWNFSNWITDTIARGQIPFITWEAMGNGKTFPASDIIGGKFDAYINTYAQGAAALPGQPEVWIRLFHEFNDPCGTSYPWQCFSAADFVNAWRHVWHLFHVAGASNVKWVWNIDGWAGQDIAADRAKYPGDAYVDYVGWDQYGYTPTGPGNAYDAVSQIAPTKPIVIPEVGSTDLNNTDYATLMDGIVAGNFPLMHAVCYFDIDAGGTWSFGANPNVTAYTKAVLAKTPFTSSAPVPPPPTTHTTPVTNLPFTMHVNGVVRKGTLTGTFTWLG